MQYENILVWLPSPLGDAVMATPALRALRRGYKDSRITFVANKVVAEALSPSEFYDEWLILQGGFFKQIKSIRNGRYDCAILFKNSFSCALKIFLSGIKERVGYNRDMRGALLTKTLSPPKKPDGSFLPRPMMLYYLELLSCIGIEDSDTSMTLSVSDKDDKSLDEKLGAKLDKDKKLAIVVPGGAFGPSKCWPTKNYAELCDTLIQEHNCLAVVSVAPNEKEISEAICNQAKNELIDLAQTPLSLGELKALFKRADIVITNDTGPRHFAVALDRKVVTLFGPNDPVWTDSKHKLEIQLVANTDCSPCGNPVCKRDKRLCMESITVEKVIEAVKELL